jgi:hypothetical protein
MLILIAALLAGPFSTLEDAVWAGAFGEAIKMGEAQAPKGDETRGLKHLAEARDFLLKDEPSPARSALRKAAGLYPALGQGTEYWSCKMYRREQQDKKADECFQKAGIDEKTADARMKKLRDGLPKGSVVELAACSGLSCGYGGVPTSGGREKYDEPDTKQVPAGPSGASGGSGGTTKK